LHRNTGALSRPNGSSPSTAVPRVECGDTSCIPCSVLTSAGARLIAQWSHRPRSTTPAEVAELLAMLTEGAHRAHASGAVLTLDERARSTLGRRLLELLRAEVLRGWKEHGAADSALLPLLAALERVRAAIEPNWAQSFASHLSGSEGLTLLMDVAHDLRSPLTSILVLAETLQRGQSGDVNDIQRRQLGLIYTAALRLSAVASDIIEFTQGGDQLVDQEPVPFSVTAMLESVRDIVRPIAEEKHLTVRLLAPTVSERIGHPVALSRVLLNLTTNALKFTDEGYVEIVAQEMPDQKIEFAVRDSGRGMEEATIATLFQPLRKAAGRRGQLFSQTGLGLTICRKLAGAMGSELRVESRIGWGTRFYFELELPECPRTRTSSPRMTAHGGSRGSDPRHAAPVINAGRRRRP
jgi:signal transduction histidine kinase